MANSGASMFRSFMAWWTVDGDEPNQQWIWSDFKSTKTMTKCTALTTWDMQLCSDYQVQSNWLDRHLPKRNPFWGIFWVMHPNVFLSFPKTPTCGQKHHVADRCHNSHRTYPCDLSCQLKPVQIPVGKLKWKWNIHHFVRKTKGNRLQGTSWSMIHDSCDSEAFTVVDIATNYDFSNLASFLAANLVTWRWCIRVSCCWCFWFANFKSERVSSETLQVGTLFRDITW